MRRHGPTLTLALWDPARGSRRLRADAEEAAGATRLPVSLDDGAEEGLLQVHVWAGSLGLGLPSDPAEAWDGLGRTLGSVTLRVSPALALCAPEWGAGSLSDPDAEELRPGLGAGWARRSGLDPTRAGRFDQLAQRRVVAGDPDGWTWRAAGAVPLGDAPAVEADRLVPAIFHAWWGRRPDDPAPRVLLLFAARSPAPGLARAVAEALPDGYRVEARSPTSVVAEPPEWGTDRDTLLRDLAEAALLVEPQWAAAGAGTSDLDTVWLSAAPAPDALPTGVELTEPAAGAGVLLRGPYARLAEVVGLDQAASGRS